MTIILQAVSLNEQPLSQPIAARFDGNGGTIGRADHNTMALPDPERHISRVQAEVVAQGAGRPFLIRNLGAANPIFVGNRSLAEGESAPLSPQEPVRIGGYLLRVGMADPTADDSTRAQPPQVAAAPAPRPAAPARAPMPPVPAPPASSADPFADLFAGGGASSGQDPFADLMSPAPPPPPMAPPPPVHAAPPPPVFAPPPPPAPPPTPSRSPAPAADPFADLFASGGGSSGQDPFADLMPAAPAGVTPGSAALAAAPTALPNARLPDDFDPFAPAPPPAAAPSAPTDPFADLMPRQQASVDDFFGLGGGSAAPAGGADPLAAFMADAQQPAGSGLGTDPLAMFGAPAAPPAPVAPQRDDVHLLHAAFEPPPVMAPPPPVQPPPPPAPAPVARPAPRPMPAPAAAPVATPATGPGDAALWQALCQGAGVQLPMPPDAAQRMQAIGRILRASVEGTHQLVALRASTRTELHAAVTMIQARSNNPLKFSPDAQSSLEQLMQPAARGFLDGPAAMQDAMQDLVGHAIGTMAGMRAALEGLLDRFDPASLETRLTSRSRLEGLLSSRRARLWDLYLEHYKSLRDEAQDDFDAVFGKAFLAAYEEQVARLRQGGGAE